MDAPFAVEAPAPSPTRQVFWDYWDLLLMVGFVIASILSTGFLHLALVPANLRTKPVPLDLWLQLLAYGIIYLGFLTVFRLRYNKPALESLGWRPSNFNPILACISGALLAIALSALGQWLRTPENDLMDKLVNSWVSFVVFAITAVLIAPLFEELLFRGFIQPLLSRTFGVLAGVALTSALFGCLHAPEYSWIWQYALVISLAGAAFGWIRVRTRSVVPGTIMHCCFNSISVFGYLISSHPKFK
jgi:membrane protease YdiL (CAAX protease family)